MVEGKIKTERWYSRIFVKLYVREKGLEDRVEASTMYIIITIIIGFISTAKTNQQSNRLAGIN